MQNIGSKTVKDWARLGIKLALVLTEPKVRAAISDQVKDRVEHTTKAVSSRYEDAVERLEAAGAALQGRRYRPSRVTGFLLGIGVGAGLGILLAPAAGSQTREAIRGKAVDLKNKVAQSKSTIVSDLRHAVTSMPATGTEG